MKRICVTTFLYFLAILGIVAANNVILLRMHPLAYYYTPTGLLISTAVMTAESPVFVWITVTFIRKVCSYTIEEES